MPCLVALALAKTVKFLKFQCLIFLKGRQDSKNYLTV